MEKDYSQLNHETTLTTMKETNDPIIHPVINVSPFERDSFEPIEPISIKDEESIIDVACNKDYQETILRILKAIENYNQDIETYDDYPYFRVQNTIKFIPKLSQTSEILSERQLKELHINLPYYQQYKNLKLLYSTTVHGIKMKTFFDLCSNSSSSIIVMKDDEQNVFGGYLSEQIKKSNNFYGTGESFVFTFYKTARIHIFQATCENDYYIYSDQDIVAMGCSDNNFSWVVRDEFLKGSSRPTITYKNLNLSDREEFFITKFEVWTFEE